MVPCFMSWGMFIWCTLCFEIPYWCFWDTLVLIVHLFFFDIPFVPFWRDAHHACSCVILIGVWLRVLVVENLLEPLLCEGLFPCMIETKNCCVHHFYWQHLMQRPTPPSLGPEDIVPPGQTLLTTTYVFMGWWLLCSSSFLHELVFLNVL